VARLYRLHSGREARSIAGRADSLFDLRLHLKPFRPPQFGGPLFVRRDHRRQRLRRQDVRPPLTRHRESQRQDAYGYDDRPTHASMLVSPDNMHNLTEVEGRLSWWLLPFCSSRLLALGRRRNLPDVRFAPEAALPVEVAP
jgi:hypothetical protein